MATGFTFKNSCLVVLSLIIGANLWAQDSYKAQDFITEYENLRLEYADDYRDSLYLTAVMDILETSRVNNSDDFLLQVGLENWPNFNAIGYYSLVIRDIEYIKESEQIYLSAEKKDIINLILLEAYYAIRDAVSGNLLANEIIEMSENEGVIVSARGLLSSLYGNVGNYKEAAAILIQNLVYYESLKDTSSQIVTLNNLGVLNETLNNNVLALELYKKAERLALSYTDLDPLLLVYSSLGVYYKNIEDFEKSKDYYDRAIKLSKKLKDMSAYAQNNFNLGNIYYEQGQFDLASDSYDVAYKVVDELNYTYPMALIGMMRGALLMDLNAYSAAEKYFLEAEGIIQDLDDVESQLFLDNKLAILYEKKGNYKQAFEYRGRVIDKQQTKLEEGDIDSLNVELLNYQLKQGELLLERGRLLSSKSTQASFFVTALILVLAIGLVITLILNQKKKLLIEKLFKNAKTEFIGTFGEGAEKSLNSLLTLDIFKVELASTSNQNNRRELFFELFEIIVKEDLFTSPDLGLNQLAKKVQSNTAYVSEAINSNLGMGFNAFINRIRTKKAQYLLLNTDMIIEDIMEYCGYRNRSTFYRAFQNETGLTPGEFLARKSINT